MKKKVLILGGGYAGVEAALALNKKKKKNDIEITVIDKNDYHTLLTELHEVAGNRISEDGIKIPFKRIFKYTDVKYITDEITGYDFKSKLVSSEKSKYSYDYLVLAMGSTPNFYGIPGLKEHGFTLWSYDDAVKIREHIINCFKHARCENDPEVRRRLLTFVVSGAGFTGVEMIGELAQWVKKLCREYDIPRSEVRLMILDLLPRILNVLDEKNSFKAHKYMEAKLGVEVLLNTAVKEVKADGFSTGGNFIPCSTLIWAAGVCASNEVSKLDIEKVASHRLKVDDFCATEYEGVYAVGDISGFSGKESAPYPAMVENAIQTGHGVAINILRDIHGQEKSPVEVKMHGVMVSVGNYFAVSNIMGRTLPSWLSIVMKFIVNIHYLWGITGFWGVARYLYHEILERRQLKNIVEQHYSTRVQAWWLVPLRVFLGAIWLYEGIVKITEGWLKSPMLQSFFGSANSFYENAVSAASSASAAASNAVSSATVQSVANAVTSSTPTEGAAATVKVLFNWDWGWLQFIAVQAQDIAFKIRFSLMDWIVNHVLLSSDGMQLFFQWFVVLSEIIIGLCLIGGVFTFLASGFSLILQINFVMTTGLYKDTWWMVFAGIAVLAGAGRAFGLDYYLIPYLNNFWERIWKSRSWKLGFKHAFDRHE